MVAPLTASQLWELRQHAVRNKDCELSRLCSAALWGESTATRSHANRKIRARLEVA